MARPETERAPDVGASKGSHFIPQRVENAARQARRNSGAKPIAGVSRQTLPRALARVLPPPPFQRTLPLGQTPAASPFLPAPTSAALTARV